MEPENPSPAARPSSPGRILAIGCGAGIVVLIVIAVVLQFSWKRIVASFLRTTVTEQLERSDLPEDERNRVSVSVDRFLSAFEDGKIEQEKVQELINELERSPLSRIAGVYHLKASYVPNSGLSVDEKAAADRAVLRLSRGILEGKIGDADLDGFRQQIPQNDQGKPDFNKEFTDRQLRTLLEGVGKLVDERAIPDEDHELRVADEVERIVEDVLEGTVPVEAAPVEAAPENEGGTG